MPRYVVERSFEPITDEQMQEALAAAGVSNRERFPQIEWEHTHLCQDSGGAIKAFCVYTAPNAQVLYDHAETFEAPSSHHVYELVGDIDPQQVTTGAD